MKERQLQLLRLLYEEAGYITARELAGELGCSERTVRGDISELKEFLEIGFYGSIQAKGNRGYHLETEPDGWTRFLREHEREQKGDAVCLEGYYAVLEQLFLHDTVKTAALEQKCFANYKNVSQYVNETEEWLDRQGLLLQRRRGKGLSVEGEGYKLRLAFLAFYCEVRRFCRLPSEKLMQSLLPGIRLEGIRQATERIEETYNFRFSYDGYERFSFLLFLMIFDYRKKRVCHFPEKMGRAGSWEWEAADMALQDMRKWYQVSFPEEERVYICYAIASSEIMDFRTDTALRRNAEEKKELLLLVRMLIRMVGAILQRDLTGDKVLENGLLHYLGALTAALCFGSDTCVYGSAMQPDFHKDITVACQSANHLLEEYLGIHVTEYEIAVLASHFAGAVERNNIDGSVYIICNCGVGVSRFLCEQMKRAFPNVQVLGELTPRDLIRLHIPAGSYDLLVTTVELAGFPEESVVRIGNSLQRRDIENISKMLMKKNGLALQKGYPLFEEELLLLPSGKQEKQTLIHELCMLLKIKGYVREGFEENVLVREKSSNTFLLGGIAIPHSLPEYVRSSRIAAALLDTPLAWNTDERVQAVFLLALNFKSARGVKESVILFYRNLIDMVDEPRWIEGLRALKVKKLIVDKLNELIREYR